MIDRYLVRYFLAVMDTGNFSRAAARCGVSQPTLSVGIAKLETMLARQLFDRTNRRVAVTQAGSRFADHARRIEAEFAEAERDVAAGAPARRARIGIVSTLPSGWLEEAVRAAAGAAGWSMEIVEGSGRELASLLDRGRVDAALTALVPPARADLPVFTEGYAMMLPAGHALADRAEVLAQELAGETMLVRRHCEALPAISRFFTTRGVRPMMAARTVRDDRAIAYVRAGLGITMMPDCFAAAGVTMVRVAGFDERRVIAVRTRADRGWMTEPGTPLALLVASLRHRYEASAPGDALA